MLAVTWLLNQIVQRTLKKSLSEYLHKHTHVYAPSHKQTHTGGTRAHTQRHTYTSTHIHTHAHAHTYIHIHTQVASLGLNLEDLRLGRTPPLDVRAGAKAEAAANGGGVSHPLEAEKVGSWVDLLKHISVLCRKGG